MKEEEGQPRGKKKEGIRKRVSERLRGFADKIAATTVLDPACGSGNFLYVALRLLLDLQNEVIGFSDEMGAGRFFISVTPGQLYGIEINEYAHELAQMTIQIGYIQWLRDNGYGQPAEPILKPMENILQMDAILTRSPGSASLSLANHQDDNAGSGGGARRAEGVEPQWPAVDVIVGNPPFLGDKKMRSELGHKYVEDLRKLYESRIPGQSDLVCYFFEKARAMIEEGKAKRAGLLATNSIRNGANRSVLERIKASGDIFWAQSDHEWVLDGAAVNVSMVGFDNGNETEKHLDNNNVASINADLSSHANIATEAKPLSENAGLCFLGMMKGGPFDIDAGIAHRMLTAPVNPNGKPNSDVVKRRLGGQDIVKATRDGWIIDFNNMSIEQAAVYELPFEYVKKHVKPVRDVNRDSFLRTKWWLHGRSRPELRSALMGKKRCIITPEVAKHRIFVWMDVSTIPDHTIHVIARDDDYFFGVLHSRIHEIWSLKIGSTLEDRPRYSSSRTFENFPFPWSPGQEPKEDPRVQAIARAAKELAEQRDRWLNAEGLNEAEKKKRTLTNLYNARPTWLDLAHRRLDEAVFAAYGWRSDLRDEEILEKLLALNLERSRSESHK